MKKLQTDFSSQPHKTILAIGCLLMAIFCSKAFVVNPHLYIAKSAIPAQTTDYLWGFFALALWMLFYYAFGMLRLRPRIGEIAFGLLFGFVNFFGMTISAYDSWAFIGVTLSWMEVVLKCLGQAFTMMTALTLVAQRLTPQAAMTVQSSGASSRRFPRLWKLYNKHTVLFCAALFFACWLPYIVAFYPGTVIYDMCVMVRQFFQLEPMTTWHSVFTTYVFGSCIWIGRMLGSDNYGTLIYMILQSMLMAFAFGCCIRYLRRLGAGKGWQLTSIAFFGITPLWGCYAMMIGKDTLYTATLLLFMLQTLTLAREGNRALNRTRDLIAYGITALLTCLWRNNGLYVILPTAVVTVIFLARGAHRWKVATPLAAAAVLALLFQHVLVPSFGIIDDSSSGIYSIPFQQTARSVRDHKQELTSEEKEEINLVLDLEKIGAVYEPWICDPVKDTFRQIGQGAQVEKEALARYQKTWFSMLKKYPVTYLQAFMANNCSYYAFTPKYDGITYNQQAGLRFVFQNYWESGEGELHTTQPDALQPARNIIMGIANRWWTLPLLSFLYVLPCYTWLLIAVGISLAHQRRWRDLSVLMPALISFAVCLVSPVDDYMRYFLPIVAMTIPLMAYATHPRNADGAKMGIEQNG